jgi:Short repeat of unknown function (DUF308)
MVTLLSVALLVIGVERIASGIVDVVLSSSLQKTKESSSRRRKVAPFTNIGLGTVAIVFAIIALVSPALMSERSLTLLSVAISVMFNGFARVIQGAFDKNQPTWFRTFSIGIGTLSIGTSIFVTNSKMFGILFPIHTLFIVLVIYGIGMIVYGITGKLSIDQILKKSNPSLHAMYALYAGSGV